MWEHEELPEALTEASESGVGAEFYGIDPDAESVSQYVEGLILKGLEEGDYVTPQEALAILETLLRNETGEGVYSYYICTEAGAVERLGLAADILALIPFDAQAMANDPAGALPKGFWDWVISIIVTVLLILVFAALAPFLFLGALGGILLSLGLTLLGWLWKNVVLNAIKLVILVYVFIMLAITLLFMVIGFLTLIFLLSVYIKALNQPDLLNYGFLWYELNFPPSTYRFETMIVFEYSSFIDLTIPCFKIASYKNEQILFALIFSFGIPIDSELIGSDLDLRNSENQLQTSENPSNDEIQTYQEEVSVDVEAFETGEWVAFGLTISSMLLLAAVPGAATTAVYISCAILAFIFGGLGAFLFLGIPTPPETQRGYLIGYGSGMIDGGLALLGPILPGKTKRDFIITEGLVTGLSILLHVALFSEYPIDFVSILYTAIIYAGLSSVLWNKVVENDFAKSSGWIALGFVFIGLGIFFLIMGLTQY